MTYKAKITVGEIEKILDSYLEDYKRGKFNYKNILFVGATSIGKRSVILSWLSKHSAEMNLCDFEPMQEPRNESLRPDHFGFSNAEIDEMNRENSVLFMRRYNCFSENKIKGTRTIVKNRSHQIMGENYELNNLAFLIATAYPESQRYHTIRIDDEILQCFDIYEVHPDVEEFKTYYDMTHSPDRLSEDIDEDEKKNYIEMNDFADKMLTCPSFHFVEEDDTFSFAPERFIQLLNWLVEYTTDALREQANDSANFGTKTREMLLKVADEIDAKE